MVGLAELEPIRYLDGLVGLAELFPPYDLRSLRFRFTFFAADGYGL
jgi:hypothetical protein